MNVVVFEALPVNKKLYDALQLVVTCEGAVVPLKRWDVKDIRIPAEHVPG